MKKTKKAGCILINIESKKVAIIYRKKQRDYSFPKGHLEENESLIECAIRETNEETKRNCIILDNKPAYIEEYTTASGENVIVYYYISKDIGPSKNKSLDTHDTYWISVDEVEKILSYDNLKKCWKKLINKVEQYIKDAEKEKY